MLLKIDFPSIPVSICVHFHFDLNLIAVASVFRVHLTGIMDSIHCAKEPGNSIKEFLSSGLWNERPIVATVLSPAPVSVILKSKLNTYLLKQLIHNFLYYYGIPFSKILTFYVCNYLFIGIF